MTARFSLARMCNRSRGIRLVLPWHAHIRMQFCTWLFVFDKRARMKNSDEVKYIHRDRRVANIALPFRLHNHVANCDARRCATSYGRPSKRFVYECSFTTLIRIYPSDARLPVTNLTNRRYRAADAF